MTLKPLDKLEPHTYVPSAMHMGDCQVCGHLQGAPIHSPFTIGRPKRGILDDMTRAAINAYGSSQGPNEWEWMRDALCAALTKQVNH